MGFLLLISLAALLAPWLPFVDDPNASTADIEQSPSAEHWMGTDNIGRDVFARVIWGRPGVAGDRAVGHRPQFLVGGALGRRVLRPALREGRHGVHGHHARLPRVVLALALVTFLSPPGEQEINFPRIVTVLTILAVPAPARITRASTLRSPRGSS